MTQQTRSFLTIWQKGILPFWGKSYGNCPPLQAESSGNIFFGIFIEFLGPCWGTKRYVPSSALVFCRVRPPHRLMQRGPSALRFWRFRLRGCCLWRKKRSSSVCWMPFGAHGAPPTVEARGGMTHRQRPVFVGCGSRTAWRNEDHRPYRS